MKSTFTYAQGAKLGDFIHSLCVCKYNYELTGKKADLFITDTGDVWEKGREFTYTELKPILEKQEWLNSFNLNIDVDIDYPLHNFRGSKYLYGTNWLELYFMEYLKLNTPPKEYKWIDLEKDESLANYVLINRSIKPFSNNLKLFYRDLLKQHQKKAFICFDIEQYNNFKLDEDIELIKVDTLYDFFVKINSCKLFIGNQSGPSAFATAMNAPRIIELFQAVDRAHYMKDVEYYKNYAYFTSDVFR